MPAWFILFANNGLKILGCSLSYKKTLQGSVATNTYGVYIFTIKENIKKHCTILNTWRVAQIHHLIFLSKARKINIVGTARRILFNNG